MNDMTYIKWNIKKVKKVGLPDYILALFNQIQSEICDENKINNRALSEVYPDDSLWVSYPPNSTKKEVRKLVQEYFSYLAISFEETWMLYPEDLEYIWHNRGQRIGYSEDKKGNTIYPIKAEKINSMKTLKKVSESAFEGGMGNLVIFLTPNLTVDFEEHAFSIIARTAPEKLKVWKSINFLKSKYNAEFNVLNNRKNINLIKRSI